MVRFPISTFGALTQIGPGPRIALAGWLVPLAMFAALCCLFAPQHAEASVSCTASQSNSIDFGSGSTATGQFSYTCTNYNYGSTSASFTLCALMATGSQYGTPAQPQMVGPTYNDRLDFYLYTDPATTQMWSSTSYISKAVTMGGFQSQTSGAINFYGRIPGGQSAPAGQYSDGLYQAPLGVLVSGVCRTNNGDVTTNTGNISAHATVSNNCTVTANGPANFGTVPSSATNLTASTSIAVKCPSGTAYRIGLAPSNGNAAGAGVLTGTGGNTDHPPYQLRSASSSGPIWGNTATATSTGNGVAGTGNGSTQTFSIYVTALSANYTPDSYSDTVTVNLNF